MDGPARTALDRQLRGLEHDMVEAAALVADAMARTAEALGTGEHELAAEVVRAHPELERVDARTAGWSARARARDVELAAYELVATQQPMALDLRHLTALVRLTESVARSGDLVAHVARSACFDRPADAFSPVLRALVVEMAATSARLFGDALEAYETGNAAAGRLVEESDPELDLLRNELLTALLDGEVETRPAIDLALLGRFYERLGDHAVEIGNRTSFVSTGEAPSS